MSKLPSVSNLSSGFRSSNKLNENFDEIKAAFLKTLSRDGSSPNQMEAPLDMNSQRVINLPESVDPTDAVRKSEIIELQGLLEQVEELLELGQQYLDAIATTAANAIAAQAAEDGAEAARDMALLAQNSAQESEAEAQQALLDTIEAAEQALVDIEDAVAAEFFNDEAAALAGTVSGEFFKLIEDGRINTYQNVSGVAVLKASAPKTADVQEVLDWLEH